MHKEHSSSSKTVLRFTFLWLIAAMVWGATGPTVWAATGQGENLTFGAPPMFRQMAAGSGQMSSHSEDPITRISGNIQIDGRENDSQWAGVAPLPMSMYQPVFKGEMTERTVVKVAYDDTYLYVMASLFDSDPSGILSSTLHRDGGTYADDYLNIIVDPFNDNENGLWFYTNPAGIRGDVAVTGDASGFDSLNDSWNTFWDVSTRTTDEGWFAEFRIPFSSLGFQSEQETTTMGISISRVIARKNERHVYPAIEPNWELGYAKPSLMQDVSLSTVKGQREIYFTPYVRSEVENNPVLSKDELRYDRNSTNLQDMGLDVRYNITGNLTADVSINTDFAQAEVDDQQINLGRYSLFFPEKRQFFQERAGIFDFSLGFQDRLFHSRQIGLTQGLPTQVFGGGRLVGRIQDWDVGLLSLQTEDADLTGSENFTVLRSRKRVFNDNSWAGGMVTSRVGSKGGHNVALGLDGVFKVKGDEYLTVRVAQSSDDSRTSTLGAGFNRNGFVQLQWQRRRQIGLNYMAWFTRWEEDFVPETGFYRLTDFTQGLGRLAYNWLPGESSRWRTVEASVFGNLNFSNSDGVLESGVWGTSNSLESKNGVEVQLEILGNHERLSEGLSFPKNSFVPEGEHTYFNGVLAVRSAQGKRYRLGGSVGVGELFDGRQFSFDIFPTWNASKYLELTAAYLFNRVRFADRDQGFDSHIARIKVAVAANSKLSASSFLQLNSASKSAALNLRIRYNFRERNDLWVVYNDGFNTDRTMVSPRLPFSSGRILLLKYTYTFAL